MNNNNHEHEDAYIHDPTNKAVLYPLEIKGVADNGLNVFGLKEDKIPNECAFDELFLGRKWTHGSDLFKKVG